jgi:hypothetical protein
MESIAMNQAQLEIRELAAWGFDLEADRGLLSDASLRKAASKAKRRLVDDQPYVQTSPILEEETRQASASLGALAESVAASGEFEGFDWKLALVDLGKLIAFQRRIGFRIDEGDDIGCIATLGDLLEFALPTIGPSAPIYISANPGGSRLAIRTLSPNLRLQFTGISNKEANQDLDCVRLLAHSGSPYVEAASYNGRWFLRDGYHRAFRFLQQGICHIPAVVVKTTTLAQLGAVGSRFFAEEILFSERPPMVVNFLEDEFTVRYRRQDRGRVFHISIEEQPVPASVGCEQEGL